MTTSAEGAILPPMEPARAFGGAALRIGIVICGFAVILALALGSILLAVPVFLCGLAAVLAGAVIPLPASSPASPGFRPGFRSRAPPSR